MRSDAVLNSEPCAVVGSDDQVMGLDVFKHPRTELSAADDDRACWMICRC